MLNEILLALIQAATEFFPVSSSGHLALFSNLFSEPNLFFFTVLHMASLLAVVIFTRREIGKLLSFDRKYFSLWLYLIIATIPAVLVGFFFSDFIKSFFSSFLFLFFSFLFTGVILLLTKFGISKNNLGLRSSLVIGLFQALALFPGISRSGMTISSGMFLGVKREEVTRFSFLLLIPLVLGAFLLEFGEAYFSISLLVSFFVCLFASLVFLNFLMRIVSKGRFWMFSFYCFALGIVSLILYLIG